MAMCKRSPRRVPNRFYPAPSIEGALWSFGILSWSGDIQASAPVGGVIPTTFRILPSSASYVALMPFLGHVEGCVRENRRGFAGSRPGASCGGVRVREARRAGTALERARTARRYARTSRRRTSRLRARRRPCEGFLGMRSDAYANMRERARFFIAQSSLGRLGSASFPDPRKDAILTAFSPLAHR